ncbi:MAG: hypothetical protein HOK98_02000 [Rhodospirillaceae bacterium]|nr:hypothetical protein [Rhodospirillaceae bacterium]MBT5944267.1 hypothetical protein [Rhodospirillaceae bacterium]MBT6403927.1 hypothetical protein [Rhodospirillaceae bacterium]MBT6534928.1 hypothetical protein [Rhodospirillaceae bacterium]
MLYFVYRVDKPGTLDLRMKTRDAHMAFAEEIGETLYFAGPSFDDDGNMNGSVWIIHAESRSDAAEITAADPYEKVDLFETKIIRRFERTAGTA